MHMTLQNANRKDLSVVTPCFNEETGIGEFHRRVTAVCKANGIGNYEIVVVNDGSTDGTLAALRALAAHDPHLVVVDLARNFGQQIALTAGLELCCGERILILDADLQDPPELLPEMIAAMEDGAEVVYGLRRKRDGEGWFKLACSRLFYRLWRPLVSVDVPLDTGDFRLMSRKALDHFNAMPERFRFVRGMVSWLGFKQVALPYDRDARYAGTTKYSMAKLMGLATDAITSFSVVPLRLASHLGFAMGISGILMLGYTFWSWMAGHAVVGWTSLASLILVIGSGQFIVLGIFGEYLGRMYLEAKRRPLYIINAVHTAPQEMAGASDARHLQNTLRQAVGS